MASVVSGPLDYLSGLKERFAWVDPVVLSWIATVAFAYVSANSLDYEMLEGSLRVLFYATLFELATEIPDQRADTPNLEQLYIVLTGSGVIGIGLLVEAFATSVAGDTTPAQMLALAGLVSRLYANYATEELSLRESLFGDDYVSHPFTTVSALVMFAIPLVIKLWTFVAGKDHAPPLDTTDTYFVVVTIAATTGLVAYYLAHGFRWGRRDDVDAPLVGDSAEDAGGDADRVAD